MAQNFKEELVGVFGHPVSENPTVVMQQAAFTEMNLKWRYLTIEVFPKDLEAAMSGMRALNMRGINLTIPHKVEVLKYLDEIKPDAALMGAVNTVVRKENKLIGENTDGKGFMWSLTKDEQVNPEGKSVVIFGAGGAARSITVELALAGAGKITIINRSPERGIELRDLLISKTGIKCEFIKWDGNYSISNENEIIINATSIGLFPDTGNKPNINYDSIKSGMVVCDVIPAPTTSFLKEAKSRGATTIDGLGMLVYQGAFAFKLWTGMDAPVKVMKEALEEAFSISR